MVPQLCREFLSTEIVFLIPRWPESLFKYYDLTAKRINTLSFFKIKTQNVLTSSATMPTMESSKL